jgi:proline dehydrogenase
MRPLYRELVSGCWRRLEQRAARNYVAGVRLEEALRTVRQVAARGQGSTLCYWDHREDTPEEVSRAYQEAIDGLADTEVDGYLSIKATALAFSPERVREVVARARERGLPVVFDAMGPEAAKPIHRAIDQALPLHSDLGCALPGRWRRSLRDVDWAIERGLRVRVVQGQWEEGPGLGQDGREGFLALIERLAGRARLVAVATHNVTLACESLRRLTEAGTRCELEQLLGYPLRRSLEVARQFGVPIRFYVPFGHAHLPYSVSHAAAEPWIARQLLVDLVRGGGSGRG